MDECIAHPYKVLLLLWMKGENYLSLGIIILTGKILTDGNKTKFTQYIESCNLFKMVQDSTRSSRNKFWHKTDSIIDLIFCNAPSACSNAKSTVTL